MMSEDRLPLQVRMERAGIRATSERTDQEPPWGEPFTGTSWKVRLTRTNLRRSLTVAFFMGEAHTSEPRAEEVLDCLISDASGLENSGSFEEWCSEYGYDTDSRKAERIYKQVELGARRLKRFLGDDFNAFLWETEGL